MFNGPLPTRIKMPSPESANSPVSTFTPDKPFDDELPIGVSKLDPLPQRVATIRIEEEGFLAFRFRNFTSDFSTGINPPIAYANFQASDLPFRVQWEKSTSYIDFSHQVKREGAHESEDDMFRFVFEKLASVGQKSSVPWTGADDRLRNPNLASNYCWLQKLTDPKYLKSFLNLDETSLRLGVSHVMAARTAVKRFAADVEDLLHPLSNVTNVPELKEHEIAQKTYAGLLKATARMLMTMIEIRRSRVINLEGAPDHIIDMLGMARDDEGKLYVRDDSKCPTIAEAKALGDEYKDKPCEELEEAVQRSKAEFTAQQNAKRAAKHNPEI